MYLPFFPGPVFAWVFLGTLLGLLIVACCTDLRRLVVPKWLTVPALFLGAALNVARGAALGAGGLPAWTLGANGAAVGALDGFLFALAGFAVGFGLFFLFWILGACGGGDVKLFAALGAWIGPLLAFFVLAMTVVVVFLLALGRIGLRLARGEFAPAPRGPSRRALPPLPRQGKGQPLARAMGLALPLALATTLVLIWEFRVDLRFASAPAGSAKVGAHAN